MILAFLSSNPTTMLLCLVLGFCCAFVAILPPGLLNMTAAKIHIKEGQLHALWFVAGALIVIGIQVFFAVHFAEIISRTPSFIVALREIGFVLFLLLTIYFLFVAKKSKLKSRKIKKSSRTSRFFIGLLLSGLNFFPIPYYVFVSITLVSYKLFQFDSRSILCYVLGAVLGSLAVFYGYMRFFNTLESKKEFIFKNSNLIIGCITATVSVFTLINIILHYWKL